MKKQNVKKIICLMVISIELLICSSCSGNKKEYNKAPKIDKQVEINDVYNFEKNVSKKRIAVVYFSVKDNVEQMANIVASVSNADLVRIEPVDEYTDEDLDIENPNSRIRMEDDYYLFEEDVERADNQYETVYGLIVPTESEIEKKNELKELPKIKDINVSKYDIIILGFPVWLDNAPKTVYSFLKDIKGKIIIPFSVDGDIGQIDQYMNNFVDSSVKIMNGTEIEIDMKPENIKEWLTRLSTDIDI